MQWLEGERCWDWVRGVRKIGEGVEWRIADEAFVDLERSLEKRKLWRFWKWEARQALMIGV
jgi:hypothetical protein